MNIIQTEIAFVSNNKETQFVSLIDSDLFQKRSIDFKTFFNIFTRCELKASIQLNTVCVQHYMHIITSIKLFKTFTTSVLIAFQHKSKTQK